MFRTLAALALLTLTVACGETQMHEAREDLGEFSARITYVHTDKARQWPTSRDAEGSEWNAALENALDTRMRRYDGRQQYDVAVTLEGFLLAPAGIPLILSPKSVAVVNVFVYDVEQEKFLAKEHQMEIFESTTGQSALLGSGNARTKEQQIQGLSLNIVDKLEEYMAEQHKENGWFDLREAPAVDPAAGAALPGDATPAANTANAPSAG